jgi:hypothetical protein
MAALMSLLAIIVLWGIVTWMLGSFALRAGGLLLLVTGLIGLATGTAAGASVLALA